MTERNRAQASPSRADGAGLRVIAKPVQARDGRRWGAACVAVAVAGALAGWWLWPARGANAGGMPPARAQHDEAAARVGGSPPAADAAPRPEPPAMPSNDPDDLAAYFRPGDPEPTGAQVIEALNQAGVRTGIGAFNPPGTSPPLAGLAVPDGYELPTGYVRHHQVTDEGVPIEPVLMFAPGFVLRDARGQPIAMPQDRIVPPELAPPGMPQRKIEIPRH
ncbi:hypothetical protein PRJ39_10165 [Lysobacter enzymogenes]|uniref:hypothetical protein n=1 Tax=Lysobacter enzymogenes TaxID=69 RepID=UPI0037493CB2